jgi:cellulose biosynthesis protein BcsQ
VAEAAVKILAFFNNRGGVGKTALVSHLGWMLAERGVPTLLVDLDPQSNLSSIFLTEDELGGLWEKGKTILSAVRPMLDRSSDVTPAHLVAVNERLHLLPGDLGLSGYEDLFAENWSECLTGEVGAFRVISAFHRVMEEAARRSGAAVVLVDLGPSLGPLNRAALLAAELLVLPLAPDLFSIGGMKNLGPTLRNWRAGWEHRRARVETSSWSLPAGRMWPLGYVVLSFGARDSRPVQAYDAWLAQIPATFRQAVLGEPLADVPEVNADPYQLGALKHYRSLMPMAMTARKPMFLLRSADGARGAHLDAVQACYRDFHALAQRIGAELGVPVG